MKRLIALDDVLTAEEQAAGMVIELPVGAVKRLMTYRNFWKLSTADALEIMIVTAFTTEWEEVQRYGYEEDMAQFKAERTAAYTAAEKLYREKGREQLR